MQAAVEWSLLLESFAFPNRVLQSGIGFILFSLPEPPATSFLKNATPVSQLR